MTITAQDLKQRQQMCVDLEYLMTQDMSIREEIIDEYVQTLRTNKDFSKNFSRIKYVGHNKVNIRGQDIIRFEIEAKSKKNKRKNFS